MFHIVLYQPEIPPNTGNIMRLCANSGAKLHLIEPLGFQLENKQLQRAGLDYIERSLWQIHEDLESFLKTIQPQRIFYCTTKAKKSYAAFNYQPQDCFVFGPESRGLPTELLQQNQQTSIKIPMTNKGRSLNLATAVGIILFEAWRQNSFADCMEIL